MTTAQRLVGFVAEPHFGLAEVPLSEMLQLDEGVQVIVLGTQQDEDGSPPVDALCQVLYKGKPAAIYVPWIKLSIQGLRTFTLDDGDGGGVPFEWVRQ